MSADRLVILLNKLEELGVSLTEVAQELQEVMVAFPRAILKEMIEIRQLLEITAAKAQSPPKKKRKPKGTGIKGNIHRPDQ